jgi:putative endonuclease
MYKTYILKSQKTNNFYIGHTSNLEDRIERHNQGRERFTKKFAPYILVFTRTFKTKAEAYRFELKLKGFKNKSYLLNFIEGSAGS